MTMYNFNVIPFIIFSKMSYETVCRKNKPVYNIHRGKKTFALYIYFHVFVSNFLAHSFTNEMFQLLPKHSVKLYICIRQV